MSKWKPNEHEKALMEVIEEAKKYCAGELELFKEEDGGWYARDYKECLGGSFVIYKNDYDIKPLISDETIQKYKVDVNKCFSECNVYVCG